MPALGMAQETGTLLTWHKEEGAMVNQGELLMTVATDKTDVEIEAPATGILRGIVLQENEDAPVGEVIAWLLAEGETVPTSATADTQQEITTEAAPPTVAATSVTTLLPPIAATPLAARVAAEHNIDLRQVPATGDRIQKEDVLAYIASQTSSQQNQATNGRVLASPKARRLAKEAGIDIAILTGSGPDNAILALDVTSAIEQTTTTLPPSPPHPLTQSPIPTSRPWRIMAQRLQESWMTVPHFYLERDVDASMLIHWRTQFNLRNQAKITYTDLLIKVVAAALRKHPRLNAAWQEEQIIANAEINIGLAVGVEDGLLVPVIHDADQLLLSGIAETRTALVERANAGKLLPNDLADGTFTISNLGMFGVDRFNAIVNPPQAAILAVGALADRVVAVNGNPQVQPMMTLTLSCDHRVVDGMRAAQFLQTTVNYLENPLSLLD